MESSDLFRGGRLFQQYLVDAWASIETNKLLDQAQSEDNKGRPL